MPVRRALGPPYNSPIADGSCGKNFIIYISNGAVQDNNSDTKTASDGLAAEGGNTTHDPDLAQRIGDQCRGRMGPVHEVQSPHGIVTYTVDVDKVTTGQGPGWTALLKSMAGVSSGKYFDVSCGNGGEQIVDAIETIFSEIQAVNSVFASVSLPVSVNPEART